MLADLAALSRINYERWTKMQVKPAWVPKFGKISAARSSFQPRYQRMADNTGVPWWVIAVIHEREAGGDWSRSIAQGDPWNQRSTHEPVGRGPFNSWEAAAYDALVNCPPYAARWKDWSIGGALTLLETYNGLGYASGPISRLPDGTVKHYPPQASPYIWSGTDRYVKGKYSRDHFFDPEMVDQQTGCAGIIAAMNVVPASASKQEQAPCSTISATPSPRPSLLSRFISLLTR